MSHRASTILSLASLLFAGCLGSYNKPAAVAATPDLGGTPVTPPPGPDPNPADMGSPANNSDMAVSKPNPLDMATAPTVDTDPFSALLKGNAQMVQFCAGNVGSGDIVTTKFCDVVNGVPANPMPVVKGLADLQRVLGLSFANTTATGGNGTGGNPAFALTGHSSSLVSKFVSSINPRAFVFTPSPIGSNTPNPMFRAMGFARGEQFVEVIAHDPVANNGAGEVNLYLFRFQQACNTAPGGCTAGDLLTPAVERNWTGLVIYEDEIVNTIFDCTQCHQPDGPINGKKMLRMQERQRPWTHFFRSDTAGQILINEFHSAHGYSEDYGPIPAALIDKSDPQQLEGLVENNGFANQPNEFPTSTIETEVILSSSQQPRINNPPGISATWQALFANAVAGNVIPPPYHDVQVTDVNKLTPMISAYQQYLAGSLPQTMLPDIRDVFLDAALVDMSFRPKPGLDAQGILVQACQHCHNSTLDQGISRANFNVTTLASLSAAEKSKAIGRLTLPIDSRLKMPPPRFSILSDAEIQSVIQLLLK